MKDLVIVGGGQSAAQCVLTLRRNDFKAPITIISEEHHLPYQRPPLSKEYLAGEVSLDRVYMKSQDFFDQNNVVIKHSMKAISLDRESKTVNLSSGDNIEYKNLVIATGSRVRELDVEGSHLKNINYLRTIDDSNDLKKYFKSGKKLVIIGAGYIGLEVAAAAVKKGLKVTVVEMADRVMNRTVDPIISEYFDNLHRAHGVEIFLESALERFEGKSGVEKVICNNNKTVEADGVVVGVGILPNQEIAESAGLKCNNGILVDEYGRTEDPSIFACGDCTNHPSFYMKKNIRLESVHNALEQAKTVALSLMGKPEKYDQVPWFWSDQYDDKLQIVGLSGDHDEIVTRGSVETGTFLLFYLKKGELIAVDSVNNPKDFLISKKLVANKLKISSDVLCDQSVDLKGLLK
tara:strand:+ start:43 stop:1257 length:1215 start_codon:yes stop_codon:yes gene_type:complete